MGEVMTKARCDCPPSRRPGTCPECPYRRAPRPDPAEEVGLSIPTFLRGSGKGPNGRQGNGGPGGGCCGGER